MTTTQTGGGNGAAPDGGSFAARLAAIERRLGASEFERRLARLEQIVSDAGWEDETQEQRDFRSALEGAPWM